MNTTLTIKTDKQLKGAAQDTAEALGVPLTTIINAMLRQFVRDREITLSVNTPNKTTRRAMHEVKIGKNLETFETINDWQKVMRSL